MFVENSTSWAAEPLLKAVFLNELKPKPEVCAFVGCLLNLYVWLRDDLPEVKSNILVLLEIELRSSSHSQSACRPTYLAL
jgi:hypothetical protein